MTTIRECRSSLGDADRARAPDARHRQIGIMLVVLAGVFWSLQGPAVRMIEAASGPQIIFWRSIGQLAVMMVVVAIVNRGRVLSAFRLAGYRAVVGALCHAAAGTCFVLAVLHTTVANVVFIMAAAPLVAAAGAWLLLRERVETRTLGAMVAAVVGIAVMMSEGLALGNVAGTLYARSGASAQGPPGALPRPVRPQCPPPPSHRLATNSPTQPPTRRRRPHQHPDELDGPAQTGVQSRHQRLSQVRWQSEGDCHCDRAQCHRSDPRSLASARPRSRRTTRATPAPARLTCVPGPKTLADLGDDARVLNRSVRLTLAPCRPRAHPL